MPRLCPRCDTRHDGVKQCPEEYLWGPKAIGRRRQLKVSTKAEVSTKSNIVDIDVEFVDKKEMRRRKQAEWVAKSRLEKKLREQPGN